MTVVFNQDKKRYEMTAAGTVIAVLHESEAKTKKEASTKIMGMLTDLLKSWQPQGVAN